MSLARHAANDYGRLGHDCDTDQTILLAQGVDCYEQDASIIDDFSIYSTQKP